MCVDRHPATLATQINKEVENIGARRLHTIIERLMEDLSFTASERAGETVAPTLRTHAQCTHTRARARARAVHLPSLRR